MDSVSSDDEIDWMFDKSNQTPVKQLEEATSTEKSTPSAWILSRSGNTPDTPYNLKSNTVSSLKDQRTEPGKRGRKSLTSMFPNIVPTAKDFIEEHGYQADSRRRCDTARSSGVTLDQIKNKLVDKIPGLKERGIHKTTVHHMLAPPDKRLKSSSTVYKQEIDAKLCSKQNNIRKEDANSHFYSTRVKYSMEFASKYSNDCVLLSCDNKNKIHIGTLAVSRYHQLRRFYPSGDRPDFPDHDFPFPGYLITPCGYMLLCSKSSEQNIQNKCQDELNREHYPIYRTGPLTVVNRVSQFHKSTVESHTNDLIPILKEQFSLDALVLNSYCPGQSAYNPIEHAWSPLSDALAGVILPPNIHGEEKAPCQQKLSKEEKTQKEAVVFDTAMRRLNEYWNNLKFDGFDVKSLYQPCLEEGGPTRDHSHIHELLSKSPTAIKKNPELFEELQQCIGHIYRRIHSITIIKCTKLNCIHCTENPVIKQEACSLLRRFKGLPSPRPDTKHEGHFLTFIDICDSDVTEYEDIHMPKYQQAELGKCPDCPLYCFTSQTEKQKHRKLFHQ
ncbi:Hypothetical predicted protein [Mytilus galloprovincialis]|uniref:C2H2-type domain-containing protein n=1 Tax=Mytilus galloprovincialis TaxID=29158 RepID=A0A8B6E7N5_MYTGA|nr:Hypothetical predicted protein [Mytilus galloprovincialis]